MSNSSDSKMPSASADSFDYFLDKATGLWTVTWFERDTTNTLVKRTDPQRFRKEARAKERVRQHRKEVAKLKPHARWDDYRGKYILVWYEGDPPRQRRSSLGTADKSEIPARMERKLAELGLGFASQRLTVAAMLDRYLADVLINRSAATRAAFVRTSQRLQQWLGGSRAVTDVDETALAEYRDHRLQVIQPSSFSVEATHWNAAVRWHQRKKLLAADEQVALVELPKVPHRERLSISKDDHTLILEALRADRLSRKTNAHRPSSLEIYTTMVRYTGGRSCFYDDLQWSQVDWANQVIDFQPAGATVSANKRRPKVPIAAELLPFLQEIFALRQPGEDHVLWQRGRRITSRLNYFARSKLAQADNPRLRELAPVLHSHAFRRSYITWAVSAGLSTSLIARVTGNSPAVIEKYYFAYRPDMGRVVVDRV